MNINLETLRKINQIIEDASQDALRLIKEELGSDTVVNLPSNGSHSPIRKIRRSSNWWPSTEERRDKVKELFAIEFLTTSQLAKNVQRALNVPKKKTPAGRDRLLGQIGNDVNALRLNGFLKENPNNPKEHRYVEVPGKEINWQFGK